MRVLVFCPTTPRVVAGVVERIFNQTGVEYFDVMFTRDNPYVNTWGEVWKNIQLNYEKMRQVALKEGYDKVWVVEEDTIPPLDALSKLLEVDAPVVSGLYAMRHGPPVANLMQYGVRMPGVGSGMSWKQVQANWGKTVETSGGCMGCLLIDRSVLERFQFVTCKHGAPDTPFMEFCWTNKIKQMARLDVICGHVKANGDVLYPDRDLGCRTERLN